MDSILLTGGTGMLGQEIAKLLDKRNFNVIILSLKEKPKSTLGIEILKGDIADKKSLKSIDNKFDTIIHCASNPQNSEVVDVIGSENLLDVFGKNTLKHFIYVSIVGVDKSWFPYYRSKYKVEEKIKESRIPWTILRATQFHNLVLNRIIKPIVDEKQSPVLIPSGMQFQSIDISEVAKRIVELVTKEPLNNIQHIGGPEVMTFEEMLQIYFDTFNINEKIEYISTSNEFYNLFTTGINLCPNYALGRITWKQYVDKMKTMSDNKL